MGRRVIGGRASEWVRLQATGAIEFGITVVLVNLVA